MHCYNFTWLQWNVSSTVTIYSSLSNVLDPVLDLRNPGINPITWTLTAIANYANLGKSEIFGQ